MRASSTPLSFRIADPDRETDLEALARWAADASIRHLYQVSRKEQCQCQDKDKDKKAAIQTRLRQVYSEGREVYLIQVESRPIGSVSLALDAQELSHNSSPVPAAWFGLVVGERCYRGQGIGRRAMSFIEARAHELGARRAEVGIFQFNREAIRFYQSIGYRSFLCHLNTTWWQGRQWGDIRMDKNLI